MVNTADLSAIAYIFAAIIAGLLLAANWKLYEKAKKPGWAVLIPIYNIIILLQIVKKPGWWVIWYFIPIASIIVSFIVSVRLAKAFGKSETFGILLLFLFPFVGYPILGFGKDEYKESEANSNQVQNPSAQTQTQPIQQNQEPQTQPTPVAQPTPNSPTPKA